MPQIPVSLLADIALAVILIEAVVLAVLARDRSARGRAARRCLPTLAAGIFLMMAVAGLARGATWPWLAATLAGAGVAHLLDLRGRWRGDSDVSRDRRTAAEASGQTPPAESVRRP